jgi:uncharacterized protein
MPSYFTPGVYVEEISTFPTSVVRVETAVPVFIGYTEKSDSAVNKTPIKVKSLMEFEALFGGEPDSLERGRMLTVQLNADSSVKEVRLALKFYLYQSLRLFYANGGGDAYIFSIGTYDAPYVGFPVSGFTSGNWATQDGADVTDLNASFPVLEQADEPTLILVPDAYAFIDPLDLGAVQAAALAHCNKMQDRFGIFDVQHATGNDALADGSTFRTNVGNQFLSYGASYYPELATILGPNGKVGIGDFELRDSSNAVMTLTTLGTSSGDANLIAYNQVLVDLPTLPNGTALAAAYTALPNTAALVTDPAFEVESDARASAIMSLISGIYALGGSLTNAAGKAFTLTQIAAVSALKNAAQELLDYDSGFKNIVGGSGNELNEIEATDFDGTAYPPNSPDYNLVAQLAGPPLPIYANVAAAVAAYQATFNTALGVLNAIKANLESIRDGLLANLFTTSKVLVDILSAIRSTGYTLPPSGAIAGVYATIDASRGVWKAPANVSLNAVREVRKLRDDELNDLNIPNAGNGKAINAIRLFRGQGILVYGARTLAGSDNEWRYVPVRRLFLMVEESVKKATEPYVFEPNDANTWTKVKGMIENFLLGLWRDGALAGAVPKDAFFVKVGLGQTMTADDILNGRMIVEIGMAAVRPAEFVILKFSHKMQES